MNQLIQYYLNVLPFLNCSLKMSDQLFWLLRFQLNYLYPPLFPYLVDLLINKRVFNASLYVLFNNNL